MSYPPPSYTTVTQDAYYRCQQPSAPPSSSNNTTRWPSESQSQSGQTDHSSLSHSTSGTRHEPGYFQPQPVSGSASPSFTYRTVNAAPIPVQGGYQYSPSQGMVQVQGVNLSSSPTRYPGNSARRRYVIICMLIFCIMLFVLTIAIVIVFVALRPTSELR